MGLGKDFGSSCWRAGGCGNAQQSAILTIRRWLGICIFATLASIAQPILAQQGEAQTWIQLESLPSLAQAEERARAYSVNLSPITGFASVDRSYLIAMGPYSPAEAAGRITALKSEGLIAIDAFLTDGAKHAAQFWPVGAINLPAANLPAANLPTADLPTADLPAAQTANAQPSPPVAVQTQPISPEAPLVLSPLLLPAPEQPLVAALAPQQAAPIREESQSEAMLSESALSREDKIMLQAALQWYGLYDGALDGSFGRGTRASMAAWQKEMGFAGTGVLTTAQRAQLGDKFKLDEAAFGFADYRDDEAGVEFMLAATMLEFDHYEPPFVHFVAKDGSELRLVVISEPGDSESLAALYDLLQSLDDMPNTGERILLEDGFTLSGQSPSKAAFATAQVSKGAIKGYMLLWNNSQEDTAKRVLAMMQASFRSTGDQVLDPGLVPLDEAIKSGVLAGMAVKTPKDTVSGVFVDASGLVLTIAKPLENCGKITLDGAVEAEILVKDAALDAALLRPLLPLAPLSIATPSAVGPTLGAPLILAGYSLPQGLPAPVLTQGMIQFLGGPSGEASMITMAAKTNRHDRGGPVLNLEGALVGMIYGQQIDSKTLPEGMTLALDAGALGPLLAQAQVSLEKAAFGAVPLSPETLGSLASGMTVQVSCWP